jgi:hypothetical protein
VRHVDIIEEDKGLGNEDAKLMNGHYDGTSTWNLKDSEREPLLSS